MKIKFDELASIIEILYNTDDRFEDADDIEDFINVLCRNSTETIIIED